MKDFNRVEEINIRYHNIHPSDSVKNYIESVLKDIYGKSPYGAVLTATFSDRRGSMKGVWKINSSAGTFIATAESHDMNELVKKLSNQIKKQLEKWKVKRFKISGANHFNPSAV